MKLTKLTEKKKLMLISAACVIALAVILWPLLAISKYNYASADDWSYGVHTYQVIQNHGGLIAFIQAIIDTVQESFWEARFVILHWQPCSPESSGNTATRLWRI